MSEHAYIAFMGDPRDDAVAVFAATAREARKLAWPVVGGRAEGRWTDLRVLRLAGTCDHLRLRAGPHVNDSPTVCARCELWYETPLVDGVCEACSDANDAYMLDLAGEATI